MIYSDFQGKQLSLLGFGTMRLPTLPDGTIDEAQTRIMAGMPSTAASITLTPPTPITAECRNGSSARF